MPGDNMQSQHKKTTDLNKNDLSPLILSPTRSGRNEQSIEEELLAGDDPMASNPPRPHTSAIRWNTQTTGRRGTGTRDVTTEPTRQHLSVPSRRAPQIYDPVSGPLQAYSGYNTTAHTDTAPVPRKKVERREVHWLLYVGVGMIGALALWVIASSLLAWGINKYDDLIYGNPRMSQTDAVVGHNNDSPAHPSHFLALNLHGQVIVIELPAGDPTKSIDYLGPELIAPGDELIPITLTFSDVNHDGKPDMIVHIQDKEVHFCNNGTRFTACS